MTDDEVIGRRFAAAHRALTTLAVTGTNGKTTTVSMIDAIVRAAGELGARLTTLGAVVGEQTILCNNASAEFLETVESAAARGARTLALEVTSKALAAGLAKRWPADVAVFTNLSRDHLDMHGSAEHYLASKAQLFMLLPGDGTAVLNADDESSALLEEVLPPTARVLRYSVRRSDVTLSAARVTASRDGTQIALHSSALADSLGGALALAVVGDVHAENALAAALATHAAGYDPEAISLGLASFRGVAGRFEIVGRRPRAPLIVVDYAHSPDGLRGTLATARELVEPGGRLVCVFGCGGDRDRGKRPLMGAAVDERADLAVLTTDNPRYEDPKAIADGVLAGVAPIAEWHVELDRPRAIGWAIERAGARDVVVIAGKGHETEQEIRGEKIAMSDRDIVLAAIRSE